MSPNSRCVSVKNLSGSRRNFRKLAPGTQDEGPGTGFEPASRVVVTRRPILRPHSGRAQSVQRFFAALRLRVPVLRFGTLPPFSRASLRPIAIACLRLLTFAPELLFSVPFFRRCIADFTLLAAALPYFAIGYLRSTVPDLACKRRAEIGRAHV